MKRLALSALLVAFFSIPAFAQIVTPVNPVVYDGACDLQNVGANSVSGWALGSMDFACHGTFYGNVTATISIESSGGVYSGGKYTTGVYASSSDTWPKLGYWCSSWGCFQYVTEPVPSQWHTSIATYNPPSWVSHGNVRWVTGASQCYWYWCWAPESSIDDYAGIITINDPYNPPATY